MKKIIAIIALMTLGISGANAQYRNPRGPQTVHPGYDRPQGNSINELQRDVRQRIEFGIANRFLSRREGKQLMKEYDRIAERERDYRRRGGLNRQENRELIVSLENLKRRVPFDVRNSHERGNRDWARH